MKQILWQMLVNAGVNFRVEGSDIVISDDSEFDKRVRFHFKQNELKGVTIE